MAVRIRMTRRGVKGQPFFRIVAADQSKPRDGRFLEILGTYDPRKEESKIIINKERFDYWVSKGAIPSETISKVLGQSK